jgi:type II secretory ATPase GspE/PulE/Tfp pilus assembly ATPase PilB-like protein
VAVTEHKALDQGFCSRFRICPDDTDSARIWISERTDLSVLGYVRTALGMRSLPRRVPDDQLELKIAARFGTAGGSLRPSHSPESQNPPQEHASDSLIVKDINTIISECIYSRASDIHFEPCERVLLCRRRVDGILVEHKQIPREFQAEMISRIKIMAGLDIAEKRRPQDGRIRFTIDGRSVDIRVSVIPTEFGEKAVLRLLDKESLRLDLGDLGFTSEQLRLFRDRIAVKNGIILVTGPTGSGKTTTLYATLQHLKSPEVNISTVEDPIEYNLAGINQTQVQPEIGRTFAAMLRAMLRQDPDIIMIGEIRDRETLDIAIRASLTGHLVLSTIHTNSAVATSPRLIDIGAEPYLLASCLLIVAQRLVRRLVRITFTN